MSTGHSVELDTLFGDYLLDQAFDEMREASGELRPQYRALAETLASLPADELQRRKQSADLSFLTQRITSLNLFLRDVYSMARSSTIRSSRATWSIAASTIAARCAACRCRAT